MKENEEQREILEERKEEEEEDGIKKRENMYTTIRLINRRDVDHWAKHIR